MMFIITLLRNFFFFNSKQIKPNKDLKDLIDLKNEACKKMIDTKKTEYKINHKNLKIRTKQMVNKIYKDNISSEFKTCKK